MSDELSKILAEIDFPVRYNKPNQLIEDANSLPLLKVYAAGVMTYNASIFGEELAQLINKHMKEKVCHNDDQAKT